MTESSAPAKDYLGMSIFNTLCCCLPLGIIAIIYSLRARDATATGDTARAAQASKTAKILNISALVTGLIFLAIIIIYTIVGAVKHAK